MTLNKQVERLSERVRNLEILIAFLVGVNVLQIGAQLVAWLRAA